MDKMELIQRVASCESAMDLYRMKEDILLALRGKEKTETTKKKKKGDE